MSIKFNNLFLISILFHLLIAVSAPPFIFELEQSDGQKIPVKLFGHEYYNWMETQDGYVVDWVDDGELRGLYYSVLDNDGKFINSEIFVTYPAPIDIEIAKHLREKNPKIRDLSYKNLHSKKFHSHLNRGIGSQFKPLVMLVDFPDVPKTYSKQNFSDLLFTQNLSPNLANFPPGHEEYNMSVRDYFDEVSNGKLRFTGDLESISDWKRADNNYSYYVDGSNGTAHGPYGWSRSAAALVVETAMKMDEEGFDFSSFDNGNGAVDIVILIVSVSYTHLRAHET